MRHGEPRKVRLAVSDVDPAQPAIKMKHRETQRDTERDRERQRETQRETQREVL